MQLSGIRPWPIGHLGLPPTTLSLLKMRYRIIITVHYQEESDDEYESDEDEGPYWRTALHTAKHDNTFEDEEYEYEEEDEGCDDIYYQAYPAERTSTRISEARDKSSKLPMKPQPKPRFEGVFPPPRKNPVKPTQNTFNKPEIPKPRQLPPTPAPTPVPRPQPIQPKPKPVTIIPRPQYPVDARKPRITEDVEMRNAHPAPLKPSNIPCTLPRDPPPHVTGKENNDKVWGPARQSELSSQVNTKSVVSEILNTEIPLTLGKILGASKEISLDLQERLRLRNRPIETHHVATGTDTKPTSLTEGVLIKLQVKHEGTPLLAIIDTGSQLNIIRRDLAKAVIRMPIDLSRPVTMKDANGGTGVLKGYLEEVELMCGSVSTKCDLNVGDGLPFDLLLGRKWQRQNLVTIAEKRDGTYLEFRNPETDTVDCEVLVSPAMMTPCNNIGSYLEEAYTLAVGPVEKADQSEEKDVPDLLDPLGEITRLELQETIETAIISAREMSPDLDPPPSIENYSPLSKLGCNIILQLLDRYRPKWEIFNQRKWGKLPPIRQTRDTDIYNFLAEQEIERLQKESTEGTFEEAARDVLRFLQLALEDATQEATLFSVPKPSPNYYNAWIFHHYFSAYRHNLLSHTPLIKISDCQIVEFILEEFEKFPVPEPLTFEQAERQAVQLGIFRFLTSPQGQNFLSSKFVQNCVSPLKLKTENSTRDHWTFILLFWRFKWHWKGRGQLESASVMQITDFLTKQYMEYWQNGVGTDTDINVFSVQLPAILTPKN